MYIFSVNCCSCCVWYNAHGCPYSRRVDVDESSVEAKRVAVLQNVVSRGDTHLVPQVQVNFRYEGRSGSGGRQREEVGAAHALGPRARSCMAASDTKYRHGYKKMLK